MHFTFAPAVLALATIASAANIQVDVGLNGIAFTPSSANATTGDTVQFIFHPKNHTVTQSTFAAPCQAMANGIDSGYRPVDANASQAISMIVPVNSSDPLWFYCKQATHCTQGMVFALNPTANKTFAAFQAAAKGSSSSPSASGSAAGSATAAAAPSASSSSSSGQGGNGAVATGVRAGSLVAAVGFVAGLLL